ncbi:hypothetical protein JCM10213v2_003344 [Rhodosporidiobolus nylandii]
MASLPRVHIRVPSAPFTPSRQPSVFRRPSRLILLSLVAVVVLATYLIYPSDGDAVADRIARLPAAFEAFSWRPGGASGAWRSTNGSQEGELFDAARDGRIAGQDARGWGGKKAGEGRRVATDLVLPGAREGLESEQDVPVCKKTVLFRVAGLHGFGSEVTLLLRIAALAEHYGYTLFLDSALWNYGQWADYFSPFASPFPLTSSTSPVCRFPPEGTIKRYKLVLTPDELNATAPTAPASTEPFTPNWTKRSHVVWWARDMDGVDSTLLRLLADGEQLAQLHEQDLARLVEGEGRKIGGGAGFLSPEETLPQAFDASLARLSELLRGLWTPNEVVSGMAAELEEGLGVARPNEADKRIGDLLVAVHVRLGDKFLEADHIGPIAYAPDAVPAPSSHSPTSQPGLHDDLITSYFAAAVDSINSLLSLPSASSALSTLPSSATEPERIRALFSLTASWRKLADSEDAKPTLALMSDDAAAVAAFRTHPLAQRFRIVGTAEIAPLALPDVTEAEEVDAVLGEANAADEDLLAEEEGELKERQVEGGEDEGGDGDERIVVRRRPQHRPAGHAAMGGGAWGHAPLEVVTAKPKKEVPAGFNEATFNSLPLSTRLAQTRLFVRDLTVLAHRADALVMTGSSNVGRLMTVLFEGARRARQEEGRREVRSLDTRWFPTARFT